MKQAVWRRDRPFCVRTLSFTRNLQDGSTWPAIRGSPMPSHSQRTVRPIRTLEADTMMVQQLLSSIPREEGGPDLLLAEDGLIGPKTQGGHQVQA